MLRQRRSISMPPKAASLISASFSSRLTPQSLDLLAEEGGAEVDVSLSVRAKEDPASPGPCW
eukprot:12753515-Alexandrium_andersonii.AAC.1